MSVSRSTAHRLAATAAASLIALSFGASGVGAATTDHIHEDLTVALGPNVEKLPNGFYEVTLADGSVLTTHGPDPKAAMLDGHGDSLGPGDPERDPVCADDNYMHVLYGRPAAISQSRFTSVKSEIQAHIRRMNAVLNEAAEGSGGTTADYKVLCDENGEIRVDEFVNPTAIPYFSFVVDGARQAGFRDPNADYVIFYDGNFPGVCGFGELRSDDRLSADNRNNTGGYGVNYEDCWFSRTPMHENGHTQGAVQSGAPDHDGTNHCDDQLDIMCYPSTFRPCPSVQMFDCDYDTYFDAAPEPGEWLDTHWNLGSRLNRYIVFGDSVGSRADLLNPGAGLGFSESRPPRGARIDAVLFLQECDGHAGSKIELQRKIDGSFKKIAQGILDEDCETTIKTRANFSAAVFRSFWPQQDDDHADASSAPRTIRTR